MQALILAAGLGSRLLERTEEKPKCLVNVLGKPILQYQLDSLTACGIKDIIIVVGYKSSKILDFITEYSNNSEIKIRFSIVNNKKYKSSNSSYSFFLAHNYITGDQYIHLNCDVIFSESLLSKIITSSYENVIALDVDIPLKNNMEKVKLEGTKIVKMDNMELIEAIGKASGLARISLPAFSWANNRISQYINTGDFNQNYYGILREAVTKFDFHGISAKHNILCEINDSEDLAKAEEIIKNA